jgi:hypothetical protein
MYPSSRVRRSRKSLAILTGVGLSLIAVGPSAPLRAQDAYPQDPDASGAVDWSGQTPAHVAVVDGEATLEREGVVEALELNTVLVAGDRLRTQRGRVEVAFGDGSVLDVDTYSSVDLLAETLLRLLEGRVRMTVARSATGASYRVDAAGGSAVLRTAGEYRIAAGDPRTRSQIELVVYRGSAELRNELGTTLVRAGTFAVASTGAAPSLPYPVNSAAWDDFENWADAQREERLGLVSTPYLPDNLRYYAGSLDGYGSWGYVPVYGNVWYPTVGNTWYPYSHGSWSVVAKFGRVWVGVERWSWPTHHYGRWGHQSGRWFWIPDRRWGPAWVSWASAPGYVGWCPLGFDGRPVVSITTVVATGPRLGWSVIADTHFRSRARVTNLLVPHHRLRADTWTRFADHQRPAVGDRGGRAVAPAPPPPVQRAVPRPGASVSPVNRPARAAAPDRRAAGVLPPSSRSVAGSAARTPPRDAPRSRTPVPSRAVDPWAAADPSPSRAVRSAPEPNSGYEPVPTTRQPAGRAYEPATLPRATSRTRQPDVAAPPPSRVMRSVPPQPQSEAGAPERSRIARPRESAPRSAPSSNGRVVPAPRSAPPSGGRVESAPRSAPSGGRVAPAPRSSAPSARPDRSSGRTPPPGAANRGQAQRRGGGL